jgi:hypothetical protein
LSRAAIEQAQELTKNLAGEYLESIAASVQEHGTPVQAARSVITHRFTLPKRAVLTTGQLCFESHSNNSATQPMSNSYNFALRGTPVTGSHPIIS